MKKLKIFALICIALLPRLTMGQCTSSQEKPAWVNGFFQDKNNSYIESTTATGATENEARNRAAQMVIERRSLATGQRVSVQVQNNSVIVTGVDELEVKARVLDEYRERCGNEYRVSLLVQTAKNPTFDFERVNVSNEYAFSSRAFVPGMAQLHKGSTGKGIFFITGQIALVGGIVITESLRADNVSKINSTHNASSKQNYVDNANTYENTRNVLIAGAAALYIWNVIDGITAKGKKRVVVLGDTQVNIAPYIAPQYGNLAGGVSLSFNF